MVGRCVSLRCFIPMSIRRAKQSWVDFEKSPQDCFVRRMLIGMKHLKDTKKWDPYRKPEAPLADTGPTFAAVMRRNEAQGILQQLA